MIREREVKGVSGGFMLLVLLAAEALLAWGLFANLDRPVIVLTCAGAMAVVTVALCGLFIVNPNEAKVLQLFGRYVGTVRDAGLKWANPFYTKKKISVRIRNFESNKLKVNDHDGSPIEIAAVVVWRVVDTAEAAFMMNATTNPTPAASSTSSTSPPETAVT